MRLAISVTPLMKSPAPRSFSAAGKVSRTQLGAAAALVALSAITAVVVARASTVDPKGAALDSGRRVLGAAEAWQSENPTGCPSITELVDSGYLTADVRVDDPWGTRFRIVCSASGAGIRAAGPDTRFGTSDDILVGR
jgi:hypothetical protein